MGFSTEFAKLLGAVGSAPASTAASANTAPSTLGWQNVHPGQMIPATNIPGQTIYNYGPKRPALSDFDIELMAACISNKHPVVDGQSHCFCTLKRLERGISKD